MFFEFLKSFYLASNKLFKQIENEFHTFLEIFKRDKRKFPKRYRSSNLKSRNLIKKIYILINRIFQNLNNLLNSVNESTLIKSLGIKFKKRKRRKKKSVKNRKILFAIRAISLTIFLMILVSTGIFYWLIIKDLPNPKELVTRKQILTTKIYSRDEELLYKIYRNQSRSLITYDQIPDNLIKATVAVEDRDFWKHPGFSVRGIIRAFKANLESDLIQGGSTITQQLVKNALLSSDRTWERKLKELVLAIETELILSKEEILTMYFNEIPYGGVAYGIIEAAENYFGKSVDELTLSESAMLAGIPQAATKNSPWGAHPEYAVYRQRHTLDRMAEDGYISSEEAEKAKKERIVIKPPETYIKAPHFVMYVKDLLVEKYGTRMVEEGGLSVITSIDLDTQDMAEEAVKEELEKLVGMNVTNGSVLVSKPSTGEILAMVGSRNYFDTEHDGNVNLTTALRQPGSSIKPVTYSLAFSNGMSPSTMIVDEAVSYPDGPGRWYKPVNYDNQFHGNVSLRTALGSSYNIPAVKLLDKLGVDNLLNFAKKMGITSWTDRNRFGLSLTLGGGEVHMTDMAVAYGVFANSGLKVDLHPILQVKDSNGDILDEFYCNKSSSFLEDSKKDRVFCQPEVVISPVTAYQINDVLADFNARIPGFGPNRMLQIDDYKVAVKTGTTNDKRDNWTIGYTPENVVVVWVGNNNNTPMSAVASGITGATPIWHYVTRSLLEGKDEIKEFAPPKGLKAVEICADNGLLPCASCKQIRTEYFIPGTEPRYHCVDEEKKEDEEDKDKDKNDPRGRWWGE
jgi:1A family penicillin-binding protein